jgi:hypothetical protein
MATNPFKEIESRVQKSISEANKNIQNQSKSIVQNIINGIPNKGIGGAIKDQSLGQINQQVQELSHASKRDLHKLAQKFVSERLKESMLKELDRIGAGNKTNGLAASVSETIKAEARAIIRGHKTVEITDNKTIVDAVAQTEALLGEFVKRQTSSILESKPLKRFYDIQRRVQDTEERIGHFRDKVESWYKLEEGELSQKIIRSIDDAITGHKGYTDFATKIDRSINKIPLLKELGVHFETKKALRPIIERIEKSVGANLEKKLAPVIKAHVKQVQKIAQTVAKFKDKLKKAEDAFKAQIKKYENMAIDYAKQYTQKLVNEISSNIRLGIGKGLKF